MGADVAHREPRGSVHRVSAAQQRAERIRCHLADAAEEYAQAVLEDDWDALGYDDVAQWAADQFGQAKFTPDARRQVAELLSARGKTTKQIAAATGVSQPTASRDLTGKSGNEARRSMRNASNDHEDEPPGATAVSPRPEQVQETVTAAAETVTATTSAAEAGTTEKHVCRFACRCGKTDTAFSEQAGQLMDELEEARKAACGHDAAWHQQAEWLHAQVATTGRVWDGRQFAKPPPAVAGKHAGHRVTPNKGTRWFCETCKAWFDRAEVPA